MAEIRPYDGDQPYIFISYAHANSPAVMEVVQELHHRGFRIWYDDGIEVGSEWQENIAQHLADASLMIAFVSNAYMRSDNCRKEMHYAVSKKKNLINIFLEETKLTPGMEMQIGNLFALMKYTMSDEVFYEKLWNAPQLGPELLAEDSQPAKPRSRVKKQKKVPIDLTVEQKKQKKRKNLRLVRFSVFSLLLVAVLVFGIVAWSTGLAKRLEVRLQQEDLRLLPDDTVVDIKNELLERAAREFCGIPEGEMKVSDLAGLTELYVYGDRYSLSSYEAVIGEENTGSIEDLSDLAYFTHLEKLVLAFQPLRSLETMPACVYTAPEIASVGLTAEQAKEQGIAAESHKVPMSANGKTVVCGAERGFIKVIYGAEDHKLLGAQMMCERATDMISEFALGITKGLTMEEMARVVRPHPTFSEAITEVVRV